MNRYKWMIGGLLALALGMVAYTFFSSADKHTTPVATGDKSAVSPAGGAKQKTGSLKESSAKEAKSVKKQPGAKTDPLKQAGTERPAVVGAKGQEADPGNKNAAAEQAIAAWETLVDDLVERKDAPDKERKESVKEAFDKLDQKAQIDAIHQALNLLPDEQFPSLYGILYDKGENPEVLDLIFSDALNRPEEIKLPIMKELVFDKAHPMFFESARILDVTGELDKMADGEPTKTDDDAMAEDEEPAEKQKTAP